MSKRIRYPKAEKGAAGDFMLLSLAVPAVVALLGLLLTLLF